MNQDKEAPLWVYLRDLTDKVVDLDTEVKDLRNIVRKLSPKEYENHLREIGVKENDIKRIIATRFSRR